MDKATQAIIRATQLKLKRLALIPIAKKPDTDFYFSGNKFDSDELVWLDEPMTELPPAIGFAQELRELYLSYNQITYIPSTLGNLPHLNLLHLGDNQLTEIPDCIVNLQGLQRLYLQGNKITNTCVPPEIVNLNLKTLGIFGQLYHRTHDELVLTYPFLDGVLLPHVYG